MIWDDLIQPISDIVKMGTDLFLSTRYIFDNLADTFALIFTPLSFAFNFVKGFFDGVNTTPPATAISWVFPDNIVAVFNAIPYWSMLMYAVGAGLSVIILIFLVSQLLKL